MSTTTPAPGPGTVEVPGGDLAYEVLPGSSRPVLAVHGISSHRRLWLWLRGAAPELTLVAPDLRGRADSVDVAGASSPERHADDLEHDLRDGRVRLSADALVADATSIFFGEVPWRDVGVPVRSCMSPRGAEATAALTREALA